MRPRILIGILAIAALGALWAFFLRPREAVAHEDRKPLPVAPPGTTAPPGAAPVTEEPAAGSELLGTVQPAAQSTLSVRMPAHISAILVTRDMRVRRGQRLVLLDDTEGQTQVQSAQAGVLVAQAQLGKAEAGRTAQKIKSQSDIATARTGLQQSETNLHRAILARDVARSENQADLVTAQEGVRKAQIALDRARQTLHQLEELAKVGGVSRSDLEGARSQVTVAQSDLTAASTQEQRLKAGVRSGASYRVALAQQDVDAALVAVLQAKEGLNAALSAEKSALSVADQDIRAAQAGVEQAQASASGAQSARGQTRLTSPLDGVVTDIAVHVGETVQPGVPVLSLVSLSEPHVDALVPARLLPQLHVGLPATIRVDTQPSRSFPAAVGDIAPVAEPNGRSFRVTFRFRARVSLRPGQSARISLSPR